MLLTYIEGSASARKTRGRSYTPSVSIIVPCFNEQHTVARTIESLLALRYPAHKLHVAVVDDGSTDSTWQVLQQFANNPQVTVYRKENGGKHTAMNYALEHVSSDIVGCLDADSYVHPEALRASIAHFTNAAIAAVTPNIKVHEPRTIIQRIQHAEYSLSAFVRRTFGFLDAIVVTPGPFSLFRRSAVQSVGYWRHGHGTEDYEIVFRLRAHGGKIVNEPNAFVYTKAPATLYRLYRQRVRWVYGFLMNTYDYRHTLFSKDAGNAGTFVLPFAVVSVFTALFLFGYMLYTTMQSLLAEVLRLSITGFVWSPSVDMFFVSATALVFITIVLVALTATLITIGRSLGKEQLLSINTVLYLALFGLMVPLWLATATFKAVTGSTARWR